MTCDLEATRTALAACLIAAGNTRAWWYSINDTNSETPLHELLRTTESHLIQLLLDIKLLSVHNRFKSLSISKNNWLSLFTNYGVENCELSKSRLNNVKGKPTIYYLRIGKFQSQTQFTALQQIDTQARPPTRSIPIALITALHDTLPNPPSKDGLLSVGNHSVDSTMTTNSSSLSNSCQTTTEHTIVPPPPSPAVNNDILRIPPNLLTEENEK